jgi:hypothetical protein
MHYCLSKELKSKDFKIYFVLIVSEQQGHLFLICRKTKNKFKKIGKNTLRFGVADIFLKLHTHPVEPRNSPKIAQSQKAKPSRIFLLERTVQRRQLQTEMESVDQHTDKPITDVHHLHIYECILGLQAKDSPSPCLSNNRLHNI